MASRSPSTPLPGESPGTAHVRRRLEQVLKAGVEIFAERELGNVLQRVADAACSVVGARYAALGVLDDAGTALAQFVTSGLDEEARARIGALPSGRGLLGLVIREARPIRSADINRHPQRYGFPPHHPPMTSFLGVPILGRDRVFGNLYLTEKVGGKEFTAEDEAIAVLLASQAAAAVENARLNDETQALLGQIQAMQRQRDLFFAMMNHELRNALTGVYGWAERLVRVKSADAAAHAGREVFEAAERTITLLNNFLDLSRLDAGKVRPVWRELEVAGELERALNGVRPAAEAKGIRFDVRHANGPAVLRSDPVRLEQILVNLVSNAVRHGPEGQPVLIEVAQREDEVHFDVIDQGPGIPEAYLDRIFEPFERFDPNSGVGTGLGLPVSRRLAQLLGGRLTVRSTPGQGATFTLVLPLVPPGA